MKNKVKITNIKTKVEKIVNKEIASDYLGTKEWEIAKESKFKESVKPRETHFSLKKDEE